MSAAGVKCHDASSFVVWLDHACDENDDDGSVLGLYIN
jgi:hypothetical protein